MALYFEDKIKYYNDLNTPNENYNIGIIINESKAFSTDSLLRVVLPFVFLDGKYEFYVISKEHINTFLDDLKKDICFFDTLVIKNSNYSDDFSSTLINKSRLLGIKLIYEISGKKNISDFFLNKTTSIRLLKHSNVCITSDIISYNSLILLNKNASIIPKVDVSFSNVNSFNDLKMKFTEFNIISLWDNVIFYNKRDKKSILYNTYVSFLSELQYTSNLSFIDFIKLNSFEILKNSSLFDEKWYLNEYDDVKLLNLDPIEHYLSYGYLESCNPSKFFDSDKFIKDNSYIIELGINPLVFYILYGASFIYDYTITDKNLIYKLIEESSFFDNDEYLEYNVDVKERKLNPLTHYINHGYNEKNRNRLPNFSTKYYFERYLIGENINPLLHYISLDNSSLKRNRFDFLVQSLNKNSSVNIPISFNNISVVVLVFNINLNLLKKCVESILNNKLDVEIIFIVPFKCRNDILSYLNKLKNTNNNVKLKFNKYNVPILNYVGAIISNMGKDIVLLNDFTELTYNSIELMSIKAYSSENIGFVTPLSNSIYNMFPHKNEILPNNIFSITSEGYATLLKKYSEGYNSQLSSFDGFCTFIKKDCINNIDWINSSFRFDKSNEKFELQLKYNDFIHVLDDRSYVHHNLGFFESNFHFFNQYDDVTNLTFFGEVKESLSIKRIVENIDSLFIEENTNKFSNVVLYITNEINMELTNDFLNYYVTENFEIFFLTSNSHKITLWNNKKIVKEWILKCDESILTDMYLHYLEIFSSLNIDILCIDSLLDHTSSILDLSKTFKIPAILDIKNTNALKHCINENDSNIFKNGTKWIDGCSQIIFHESNLKEFFTSNYDLNDKKVTLIDGIDLNLFNISAIDLIQNPIRIIVPGSNVDEEIVRNIKKFDINNLLEFHFIGEISESLKKIGIYHGSFDKTNFKEVLYKFKINFVVFFNIVPEIFDLLNIISEEVIPLIVKKDDLFVDFFEGYEKIFVTPSDNVEEIYQFILKLSNKDDYYFIKKEKYYINKYMKEKLAYINNIYEDIFYHACDMKQKYILNEFDYLLGYENQLKFIDMEDYLIKSYFSPYVLSPFSNEDKRCFAFMDHLSKRLMQNVDNDDKLVSIILPVFNNEDTIRLSIESVLKQSYSNFELIIIDDASFDNTVDIIKEFNDSRIKLHINNVNKGVSYSRNKGLKNASGEYIAYLDSDNEWNTNYLMTVLGAFFELPNADAIYTGQYVYENNNELLAIKFSTFNKSLLHNKNFIDLSCFCHKKAVIDKLGGFDEDLRCMVDWDFILKVSNFFKIYSIPVIISKTFVNNNPHKLKNIVPVNTIYKQRILDKNSPKLKSLGLSRPVSVIIPSYNSLDDIQQCINSILSTNSQNMVKIIVVDNNSNCAVRKYLDNLNRNGVIDLIQNDINYAFTYAVNQGINASDRNSDILLLNNDAILTPHSIEYLQKYAYSIEDCGITVPQQILIAGVSRIKPHIPYADSELDCDAMISLANNNIHNIPLYNDGNLIELNFAPFFCTYIKRSVLNESMLLDAELGRHHRSDRIFSNYVRQVLNLKIYYVYESLVYHKFQRATKKLKGQKEEFNNIVLKNRWEPELAKKLGYRLPLWDYEMGD